MGALLPLAEACGFALSKWERFALFHAFVIGLITWVVAIIVSCAYPRLVAKRGASMLPIAVVGAVIGAIVAPLVWARIRDDEVTSGVLRPGNHALLPLPAVLEGETPAAVFHIGGNVMASKSFPFTALAYKYDDVITLDRDGGKLLLSADFYDDEGNLISQIVNNEFTPNNDNLLSIEQPSDSVLTVRSKRGQRLTVEFLNHRDVRLTGDFHVRDGIRIIMTKEDTTVTDGENVNQKSWNNSALLETTDGRPAVGIWIKKPEGLPFRRLVGYVFTW